MRGGQYLLQLPHTSVIGVEIPFNSSDFSHNCRKLAFPFPNGAETVSHPDHVWIKTRCSLIVVKNGVIDFTLHPFCNLSG